jgi:ligand-binding sensor domain-containing protein
MNKTLIIFLLASLFATRAFAQQDSLSVNKIKRDTLNYISYVCTGDTLFAINEKGKLKIWDLKKIETISFKTDDPNIKYTAITKDTYNHVFVGTADGSVLKLSSDLSPSIYLTTKYPVIYIVFNSQNKLFLITQAGVYDVENKHYWNRFSIHAPGLVRVKKQLIFLKKRIKDYFSIPKVIYLDNKDRLWMSTSYGEFGTDMQVFDTGKRQILDSLAKNVRGHLSNPNSFFNDDHGNLYITSGLQHFMNWSNIIKINTDDNVSEIFDGTIDGTRNKMFIGPGAYNVSNNSIYFATTDGFYRADITQREFKPHLLFKPNLSWGREVMAIGAAMAIKHTSFVHNNKLLFLTVNNGFGIYDGNNLTMFK